MPGKTNVIPSMEGIKKDEQRDQKSFCRHIMSERHRSRRGGLCSMGNRAYWEEELEKIDAQGIKSSQVSY